MVPFSTLGVVLTKNAQSKIIYADSKKWEPNSDNQQKITDEMRKKQTHAFEVLWLELHKKKKKKASNVNAHSFSKKQHWFITAVSDWLKMARDTRIWRRILVSPIPQPLQHQSINVEKMRGGVGWRFSLFGLNGSRQTVPIVWVFEIRSPFAAIYLFFLSLVSADFNAQPDRKSSFRELSRSENPLRSQKANCAKV